MKAANRVPQLEAEAAAQHELDKLTPLELAARQVGLGDDREATPDSDMLRAKRMEKQVIRVPWLGSALMSRVQETVRSTIMGHIDGATNTPDASNMVKRNIQVTITLFIRLIATACRNG